MASIWDFLDAIPRRGDVSPEELAARRQGYADLYAGGFLSRNSDQMPLSVQGAQAAQDFIPGIGDAIAFGEAGQALSRGELAAAGLLGTGALVGLVPGAGDALARPIMAAGRKVADAIPSEALYAGRSLAEGDMRGVLDAFAPSRPAQGLGADAVEAFDVKRSDASQIFGEGSERVRYTDPQTGGTMEIVARPDQSASVLDLQVPESSRGKGIGQSLQARVMQDYPKMGGQVSSKAAATTAYRLGRRPYGNPNATLDDVFAAIDDMSSVNLVSPAAQPSPAREVAGLLSSGRANEVTDEMLAKFAPKDEMEMFDLYQRGATGMDLPMDEASRMARMAERFDEQPLYHGTANDVRGFDNMQRGAVTKVPSARSAHWLTGRYDVAGPYADLASTKPVQDLIDASRRAEIDGNFDLAESLMAEAENLEAITERGQNIMQVHGPRDVLSFNADGASYDPTDYPLMDKLAAANDGGYDAVRINDFVDNADWGSGRTASHIGVFNPTNIRSRFARFDPRLAHLRNLSAGVGGAGLLSTMMPQEEQY
jgi:predicted GNAT family acetyltransferase